MKSANREPRNFILTAIVVLSLFIPNCATAPSSSEGKPVSSTELVKIETRPGVTQKFILITPVDPVAAVVLFAAGRGKLGMAGFGGKPTLARSDNFLVRAREDFADHGLMVAVVDSPSDQQARGINSLFRISKEHVQDIEAVALPVLRHRLIRTFRAETKGKTTDDIISELVNDIPSLLNR